MKKEQITFEKAWAYLKNLNELGLIKLSNIAPIAEIDRSTLNSALLGTNRKETGKPVTIPKKHHQKLIEFVESIQYQSWINEKEKTQ